MNLSAGQKIRTARIKAGLSLRELSARMDYRVSYNAIDRYEKGVMLPGGDVLRSLQKALNVTKEYLFSRGSKDQGEILFRKNSGLAPGRINILKERIHEEFARLVEIERLVGIDSTFINPLDGFIIKNGDDVEEAARLIRKKWEIGAGAVPSVTGLLEDKGFKMIFDEGPVPIDGISGWADGYVPWIMINRRLWPVQLRAIALRELAHLVLRFEKSLSGKLTSEFCLRFAEAFLLPRETFFLEVGRKRYFISTPELIRLKETYGLRVSSVMNRAKVLDVISAHAFRTFRMRISKNPSEKDLGWFCGRESSDRYKILVFRAAAEGYISQAKAAELLMLGPRQFRMESEIL